MVENKNFCRTGASGCCSKICYGNILRTSLDYCFWRSRQRSGSSLSSSVDVWHLKYYWQYVHVSVVNFYVHYVRKSTYLLAWTCHLFTRAGKLALRCHTLLPCKDFDRDAGSFSVASTTTSHSLLGDRVSKRVWEIWDGLSRFSTCCPSWSSNRSHDKCSGNKHKSSNSSGAPFVDAVDLVWRFDSQSRYHFCLVVLDIMDFTC